jgi:hypothetical protein
MNTNSSALIVPPPAPAVASTSTTNDIRSLKGPVEIPRDWWPYLWLAGLLILGIAALLWNRLRRRWFAQLLKKPQPKPIPPHIRARQRLQAALRHLSDPRLFCFEVSETLRIYLEERFQLRAPESTTEEFLVQLPTSTALNHDQKQSLAQFLESCDLVKFARFEPTEAALRGLHESALRLVDETQFDPVAQPVTTLT